MERLKRLVSKEYLYAICFCLLCIIDQRVATAYVNGGFREVFCYLTGIVWAVIVLSHYDKKELMKWKRVHLIWAAAGAVGGVIVFLLGMSKCTFIHAWFTLILVLWCWGFVVIQTLGEVLVNKALPVLNKPFTILWVGMMVWMCVSRSDKLWPICYLIMFGCFYLTAYTKEELEQMIQGGATGIIWGFFVAQIYSFLYRPYDQVRYVGWYSNSNNNVLFYVIVLAAVSLKLYTAIKRDKSKWLKLFYFLGMGTVLSFAFFTIGRIGWITSFVLTFLCLLFIVGIKKLKSFFINGIIVVLCFCITFPISFGMVRYIPPLRHHPVWFADEAYSEEKVHSWDKWDSEKFVDLDEFLESALGRIIKSFEDLSNNTAVFDGGEAEPVADVLVEDVTQAELVTDVVVEDVTQAEPVADVLVEDVTQAGPVADVLVEDVAPFESVIDGAVEDMTQPESVVDDADVDVVKIESDAADGVSSAEESRYTPILTEEEGKDGFLVRSSIYKYFLKELNWMGHKQEEIGFQLTKYYWIGHAHNIYLQLGTDFGIPAMILFVLCMGYSFVYSVKMWLKTKKEAYVAAVLWLTVPALFGIFEFCWGAGCLTFAVMFFAWRWMICSKL